MSEPDSKLGIEGQFLRREKEVKELAALILKSRALQLGPLWDVPLKNNPSSFYGRIQQLCDFLAKVTNALEEEIKENEKLRKEKET